MLAEIVFRLKSLVESLMVKYDYYLASTLLQQRETFLFILTRKQFLIKLCFDMTVYKLQGQTLDAVGTDLRTPAFSYG